jgi:microcompartment protein CcmK/EutM
MFVGRVIGTVWSTVKWPQVQGLKLLLVRPYHLADLMDLTDLAATDACAAANPRAATDARAATARPEPLPAPEAAASPSPRGGPDCEAVVCVDLLDAGVGDDVVVAFGHAARVAAQSVGDDPGLSAGHSTGQSLGPGSRMTRESQAARGSYGPVTAASLGPTTVPTVPIDAAIVAIVDRIAVARPST